MRTQWTTKGNRDAGSSYSCDRGLHRYLRNVGRGFEHPNPPPRYATGSDGWCFCSGTLWCDALLRRWYFSTFWRTVVLSLGRVETDFSAFEHEGATFVRNVGRHEANSIASHSIRHDFHYGVGLHWWATWIQNADKFVAWPNGRPNYWCQEKMSFSNLHLQSLTVYSPVVTICTTRFSIQQFYVMPTHCIWFCVDLRTNSGYFPIQH